MATEVTVIPSKIVLILSPVGHDEAETSDANSLLCKFYCSRRLSEEDLPVGCGSGKRVVSFEDIREHSRLDEINVEQLRERPILTGLKGLVE